MSNVIKKPAHYTEGRIFEPKDVIRDWGLNFNLGNAVKYIARAGRKDDIVQDLKKAQEYIQFEIDAIEAERAGAREYKCKASDIFFMPYTEERLEVIKPKSTDKYLYKLDLDLYTKTMEEMGLDDIDNPELKKEYIPCWRTDNGAIVLEVQAGTDTEAIVNQLIREIYGGK